jgi:hypothetical protein
LNRELQLGAVEPELHFAVYPAGAAYATHVDRFRDADSRVLSVVLYLNEAWSEADGGELRLYLEAGPRAPCVDVVPHGGTLVVFLSDRFPHEVLPARRERLSLAVFAALDTPLESPPPTKAPHGQRRQRTRRGKLFAGSHGKTRSRTTNKAAATAKRNKKKG